MFVAVMELGYWNGLVVGHGRFERFLVSQNVVFLDELLIVERDKSHKGSTRVNGGGVGSLKTD